jgi:hypothetical protein
MVDVVPVERRGSRFLSPAPLCGVGGPRGSGPAMEQTSPPHSFGLILHCAEVEGGGGGSRAAAVDVTGTVAAAVEAGLASVLQQKLHHSASRR